MEKSFLIMTGHFKGQKVLKDRTFYRTDHFKGQTMPSEQIIPHT